MVVNDNYLNNIAKAMSNNSYEIPDYLEFGGTEQTITQGMTALSDPYSPRSTVTATRDGQVVDYVGTRSAAVVTSNTGDILWTSALQTDVSGNDIQIAIALSGFTQTTNYDVEVDYETEFIPRT